MSLFPHYPWKGLTIALFLLSGLLSFQSAYSFAVNDDLQFGTSADDAALSLAVDASSGNQYVVGYTDGAFPTFTNAGGRDAFIRKYNSAGVEQWTVQLGTSADEQLNDVVIDASENVYVIGQTMGSFPTFTNLGSNDVIVGKYTTGGVQEWFYQFGTTVDDRGNAVTLEGTDVYVAGWLAAGGALPGQSASGQEDAWIRKYTSLGVEEWTRQFGTSGFERLHEVDGHSGSIYVTGDTTSAFPGESSAGSNDVYVRSYDTLGNVNWDSQFGTSSFDRSNALAVDPSTGDLYIGVESAGAFPGFSNAGDRDAVMTKMNSSGVVQFHRQFGGTARDRISDVSLEDTTIGLFGREFGELPGFTSEGGSDGFVRLYDTSGNDLATDQFGTSGDDTVHGSSFVNGLVYIAGQVAGTLPGETSAGADDAFIRTYHGVVVTALSPLIHAHDVDKNADITVTFSADINGGSVSQTTMPVYAYGELVSGVYSTLNNVVTFDPTSSFPVGAEVHVLVSDTVLSTAGAGVSPYMGRFIVETDGGGDAPTPLADVGIDATAGGAEEVAAADFDGDGDLDIAVANDNTLDTLINDGTGVMTLDEVHVQTASGRAVTAVDIDNDQDVDLVTTDGNNVRVFKNDGSANFSAFALVSTGAGSVPYEVLAGDYDGDGDMDIAASGLIDNKARILLNDGSGNLTVSVDYTFSARLWGGIAADFENDGDTDVVFCSDAAAFCAFLTNNGDATFTTQEFITNVLGNQKIDAGDLDGDGDVDFFVGGTTSGAVIVNNGGSFAIGQQIFPGAQLRQPVFGDYDADGDLDLATALLAGGLKIYLNNGSASFTQQYSFNDAGLDPDGILMADMDADDDLDIVVANRTFSTLRVYLNATPIMNVLSVSPTQHALDVPQNTSVQITFDSTVDNSTVNQVNLPVYGSTLGLIDGSYTTIGSTVTFDPTSDLPAGEQVMVDVSTAVRSLVGGQVDGGYTATFRVASVGGSGMFTATDYVTSSEAFGVDAADFNGDGVADIVTANRSTNRISVILNDGSGVFGAPTHYVTPAFQPVIPRVGDVDNDGDVDIVVSYNNGTYDNISVFYNNGSADFSTRTEYPTGSGPFGISLVDVDGDSFLDLALSNRLSSTLGILRNNGSGAFLASVDYAGTVGSTPFLNEAADFNADGFMDLAVAGNSSSSFMIFMNNGDGTFAAGVDYPTGTFSNGIEVADFDGDGDVDVIASYDPGVTNDEVKVFLNDGTGVMSLAETLVSGGVGVWGLETIDVDSDGDVDILAANQNQGTLSLFTNDGSASFSGPSTFAGGSVNLFMAVADFNDDGAVDFTANNLGGGDVTVFLNTINAEPVTTVPHTFEQADAEISFQTTVSDADLMTTRARVEYTDDGGANWYDPELVSVVADSGAPDLDNAQTYQIGSVTPIATDGGPVGLTIGWDTQSASNGNGPVEVGNNQVQLRVTPNDGITDGTAQVSGTFELLSFSGRRRRLVVQEPEVPEEEVVAGKGLGDGDDASREGSGFHQAASVAEIATGLDVLKALQRLFEWRQQDGYQLTRLSRLPDDRYRIYLLQKETVLTIGRGIGLANGVMLRLPEETSMTDIPRVFKMLVLGLSGCFTEQDLNYADQYDVPGDPYWWAIYGVLLQDVLAVFDLLEQDPEQLDVLDLMRQVVEGKCLFSSS